MTEQGHRMTAPTPYDNPQTLSDRIVFPALRDAYQAGVAAVTAERDQARQMLADAKRQGQASALRQVSNAVRNPEDLMGLSWPELSDRLWAEAERLDPVAEARARAVAEAVA